MPDTASAGKAQSLWVKICVHRPFRAIAAGNTMLLYVLASDLGVTSGNPRFTYSVRSFDLVSGAQDVLPGQATFNVFHNAMSTGDFEVLGPGQSKNVAVSIDPAEWQAAPSLGVMVVSFDNFTRGEFEQTQLLPVRNGHGHTLGDRGRGRPRRR